MVAASEGEHHHRWVNSYLFNRQILLAFPPKLGVFQRFSACLQATSISCRWRPAARHTRTGCLRPACVPAHSVYSLYCTVCLTVLVCCGGRVHLSWRATWRKALHSFLAQIERGARRRRPRPRNLVINLLINVLERCAASKTGRR